jgi:hypothetical protein
LTDSHRGTRRAAIQVGGNQPKLLQRRFQVIDDLLGDHFGEAKENKTLQRLSLSSGTHSPRASRKCQKRQPRMGRPAAVRAALVGESKKWRPQPMSLARHSVAMLTASRERFRGLPAESPAGDSAESVHFSLKQRPHGGTAGQKQALGMLCEQAQLQGFSATGSFCHALPSALHLGRTQHSWVALSAVHNLRHCSP